MCGMNLLRAERLLSQSPDYRVLRRVPVASEWRLATSAGDKRRAVLVDTETTGLDQDKDEVIELALLPFEYDFESGRIVSVDEVEALSAFREPSFPIPAEATRLHGVTNEMVKG